MPVKLNYKMSADKLKVIIAGAGIAGLAVAIALQRLPYLDVELYEQADELKEIGASIAISPNVSYLIYILDRK